MKEKANAGDRIKVFAEKIYEGVMMPDEDKKFLFIKLDNGYNVGVEKKKIKKTELIKKYSKKKTTKSDLKKKKGLKTISILHTGGTIASKVDYKTGAVSASFSPEEIVNMFPELKKIVNIKSRLMSNMFSEDIRFSHYNKIAKEIEKEIKKGVDGIIITHGTDTLHYTSAALVFILENLSIPVLLVGAQRSSDRPSSDAAYNIINAAYFISKEGSKFNDVAICMHESENDNSALIMPACKTKKLHSSRRDAFKVVNDIPIARVNFGKKKIEMFEKEKKKAKNQAENKVEQSGTFSLKLFDDKLKIGVLKAHPNMNHLEIKNYEKFDGLILEGTGLGHFPINKIDDFTEENEKIFVEIKKLAKKIPVVMTTQTVFGRIDMNVYSTGRKLVDAGVLGNFLDITTETAFIKLAWLLSQKMSLDEIKKNFSKNFRGEIDCRTENREYLE